jgi:adenosylcobinamide kinase/adenosylcobinamide-phosphate guanylyltransferase
VTLIIGGARSGKSAFALSEGNLHPGKKAFIATAQALDHEMKARIARHKEERGPEWDTFEEPVRLDEAFLISAAGGYKAIVIDCLTLWVSNLLLGEEAVEEKFRSLETALLSCGDSSVYIVSNEVGMGIVPEYPLSRVYRDLLGNLNKLVAGIASRVVYMVAGIPVEIKKRP